MLNGIDISFWQEGIDWTKVKKDFVFIKATEGVDYSDPRFEDNKYGCIRNKLIRGYYHFFRCNLNPTRQALNFLNHWDNPELPPVLDAEDDYGRKIVGNQKALDNIMIWLNTVESLTKRVPIIYTGSWFWNNLPLKDMNRYPLWIAQYTTAPKPTVPRGWKDWTFWQYSSSGVVDGIHNKVDMNWFHEDQFGDLINNGESYYFGKVTTLLGLNIRECANILCKKVGSLYYGAVVKIYEERNGWGRIDSGWVSLTYIQKL